MIKINNIHIQYNRKILTDSSFYAPNEGIVVIEGESGSGKTSLIRNILFQEQQFDEYIYNDSLINNQEELKNIFSVMKQDNIFIENLTIYQHFKLLNHIYHTIDIEKYIEQLELTHTIEKYPKQLSGGEKNRINFLLCIMKNSPVYILDEPTAALDSYFSEILLSIIKELSSSHLFIIATHDNDFLKIADVIYNINLLHLECLQNNQKTYVNKEVLNLENKKFSFFPYYLEMKKYNLNVNLFMTIAIIICIVFTSMSIGYAMNQTSENYNQFKDLVNNEIIIYKPVYYQSSKYFSGDGQENLITKDELEKIKKVAHVQNVEPHIELGYSSVHDSFEMLDNLTNLDGKLYNFKITDSNQTVYQANYGDDLSNSRISLVNFDQQNIKKDSILKKFKDQGVYISYDLSQKMKISKDGQYEIDFSLLIPEYNIVGDSEIQIKENSDLLPVNYVQCKIKQIKLPVAGILKGNDLCDWSKISKNVIFISNEDYLPMIENEKPKSMITYYFSKKDLKYKTHIENDEKITNVCYAYPWVPNAYKVKIDSIQNYESVVSNFDDLGFTVLNQQIDFNDIDKIAYNMNDTFMFFSLFILIVMIIIHFILKYIHSYSEKSFVYFFKNLGYNSIEIKKLMTKIYMYDFIFVFLMSFIVLFGFQFILIRLNFLLAPITFYGVLSIIVLTFLIEFIYPKLISRRIVC